MAQKGRLDEALSFQEEAARLSNYYLYWDYLSVLYARLGSNEQAQQACERARVLADVVTTTLQCEK